MTRKIIYGFLLLMVLGMGAALWAQQGSLPSSDTSEGRKYSLSPVTSADGAEPGSIHNLPVPDAVKKVRAKAAAELGIAEAEVLILEAHEREWSDSCLGLGGPAESCAFMVTPGYEIVVNAGDADYRYRTNADGSSIRLDKVTPAE